MRALLRSTRSDDELARALARVGLYVERLGANDDVRSRLRQADDVVVVDPRLLDGHGTPAAPPPVARGEADGVDSLPLEELCYRRIGSVLDRLDGETLPNLHATVLLQAERALFRLALERSSGITAAAEMLGIHRNTFARRLQTLGLSRGDAAPRRGAGAGAAEAAPSAD